MYHAGGRAKTTGWDSFGPVNMLPPERVEQILACFDDDPSRSVRAIAAALGLTRRTVERYRRLWRQTRARGLPFTAGDAGGTIVARVTAPAAGIFNVEAERRSISRADLVAELLETIAAEQLVDVVLGVDPRVQTLATELVASGVGPTRELAVEQPHDFSRPASARRSSRAP